MDFGDLTIVQSILLPMVAAAIPVLLGLVFYGYQRALDRKQEFRRERRAVYSSFLKTCPSPLDVYRYEDEVLQDFDKSHNEAGGAMLMYASAKVTMVLAEYFLTFLEVQRLFSERNAVHSLQQLDPDFIRVGKLHNDLMLELRRDALGGSVEGFRGKRGLFRRR